MLEADGRNFQVHGLPGSADDLLQWFEEMSSVFDKQPHYPVGTLDAAYQTDSLDGAQVSFGRQASHFDDLPALHLGEESVEGAHRNELSLVHDSKTVAQSLRLLHVVRGVENSCTGFAQAAHNFENVLARLGIHSRRGLVEQEDAGAMHQSRGEIETPLHSAGERTRVIIAALFQPNQVQQFADPVFEYRSAHAIHASKKAQVLHRSQLRVDRNVLRRKPNHAANDLRFFAYAVFKEHRITA